MKWSTTKPPHGELVEVWDEDKQRVRKAKAVRGSDGVLPHWETDDGWHVEPRGFTKWRREEPHDGSR